MAAPPHIMSTLGSCELTFALHLTFHSMLALVEDCKCAGVSNLSFLLVGKLVVLYS